MGASEGGWGDVLKGLGGQGLCWVPQTKETVKKGQGLEMVNEGGFRDEADVRLEREGCIHDDTKVVDLGHITKETSRL